MAMALDDWASVRWNRRNDLPGGTRCSQAARAADPDEWRNKLRMALVPSSSLDVLAPASRISSLRELASTAQSENLPSLSSVLLGTALLDFGDAKSAEAVLRAAQRHHPTEVWINYELALCLQKLSRQEEAIRYFTAARPSGPKWHMSSLMRW